MPNLPISGLNASAANLTATDLLPVVQTSGVGPVKMTGLQIKTYIVGAGSVSIASGKTLTASNSLTLAGTDGTTMTFPSTNATLARTDAGNTFTGNQVVSSGSFGLSGNISSAAWTTSGIRYANVAATLTDTSSTGTVATAYTDVFGGNTIAASNATTFTNYYTAWVGAPTAGTNVTFTGKWALGLGGSLQINGGTVTTNTTPALDISQTWSAGAVTFKGISLNVTDTASSALSGLIDLSFSSLSYFRVGKGASGYVYAWMSPGITPDANNYFLGRSSSATYYNTPTGTFHGFIYNNGNPRQYFTSDKVTLVSGMSLGWTSNATNASDTADLILTRADTAKLQLGAADVSSGAVTQTLQVQSNTGASTTGPDFKIIGSGGTTTGGNILIQTKATTTAATALSISPAGVTTVCAATATPAAGSTSARLLFGTTAGFGIYYGSGAPTVSAAQGSIYLRSDGTTTNDRLYVNTNGSTTWTAVTTAA